MKREAWKDEIDFVGGGCFLCGLEAKKWGQTPQRGTGIWLNGKPSGGAAARRIASYLLIVSKATRGS